MIVNIFKRWLFLLGGLILAPLFFYSIHRRKKMSENDNQLRILVIPQLTRIGDLVCATPVFRAIKEKFPRSFLAVLATRKNAGIIKNNPHIDEIIIFRNIELFSLIRKIRESFFDWSFCLAGSSFGTLVSFYGLIPHRAKIIKPDRPFSEILTDWLNQNKLLYHHHTYLPAYYLKILGFIGIINPREAKEVFTSFEGEKKAEEFLSRKGVEKNDLLAILSITAGNKVKEWGDNNFKTLAQRMFEKYGAKTVFIGSQKDERRIDELLKGLPANSFMKAVDFLLEELPSLIKRAGLFIGADTGPLYIAHALGVPLIDIVGPFDWREQAPQDEKSLLVKPPAEIEPSLFVFKKPGSRKQQRKAVSSTSVEDVFEAVGKIVGKIKINNQ